MSISIVKTGLELQKRIAEADVWYFAIGSMMNPTSMKARDLHPIKSMPAILQDCLLEFFGSEGMAKATP